MGGGLECFGVSGGRGAAEETGKEWTGRRSLGRMPREGGTDCVRLFNAYRIKSKVL